MISHPLPFLSFMVVIFLSSHCQLFYGISYNLDLIVSLWLDLDIFGGKNIT